MVMLSGWKCSEAALKFMGMFRNRGCSGAGDVQGLVNLEAVDVNEKVIFGIR
jgi:hypothetical protein